jgi:predicted secreted protein
MTVVGVDVLGVLVKAPNVAHVNRELVVVTGVNTLVLALYTGYWE